MDPTKQKLLGIWQLQWMEVNGSHLAGNSVGNWLWEFNSEGGYLHNVAGAKEKGIYKLDGKKLMLIPVMGKARVEHDYNIVTIDSVEMDLVLIDKQSKSELYFLKKAASAVGEKD